jgi:SNF2 family DNA or RNA helicase
MPEGRMVMELFPHQVEAVAKFTKYGRQWPHVLLGDDMGLGKTVTAIALDKEWRTFEHGELQKEWLGNVRHMTLVVTLKSLISMWEEHFAQWNPDLKVLSLSNTARGSLVEASLQQKADVFIVNWETLRLEPRLAQVKWLHMISDEVQKAKNRKALLTVAWKNVRALHLTDMSGTWADNAPDDGWSILNHLYPRKWSSYWAFYNHHILFQQKINPKTGQSYRKVLGVHDEESLQEDMRPFYVRRTKEAVLKDLPEKSYSCIRVRLHPQQRRAYDDMRRDMLAWVGEHESDVLAAPVVIAKLMRLQQLAVAYGEMRRIEQFTWRDLPSIDELDPDNVKYMLNHPEMTFRVDPKAGGNQTRVKEIVSKLFLTDPSAKLDAFMELLEQLPAKESIVVFGQSKQAIHLLAQRLDKAGESYGILTGDVTSDRVRGQLVTDFQAGKFRVFMGTIKAGGVGITLHRASNMVFLDRDWSPSKNRQAEDRIHRIGQKNACMYYDLMADDTIDMGRFQQIQTKWEWIKKILGS